MGHNVSIIAAPSGDADTLLAALHLSRTDLPDPENMQASSGGFLRDHFILWRNWRLARPPGPFKDHDLIRASERVPLLLLDVSESTMFASLRRFEGGRQSWIAEASDGDEKPLTVTGPVPTEVTVATNEIRAALVAEGDPEGGDFEVPVLAFQRLTGHRYDEVNNVAFVQLHSTLPEKRPFWKVWA